MIKRLAGCIRQYKRDTVLTPLFMLGEVSCECVIPLLTAELINNIQAGCSMNVILQFGLKLFLVAMLSLACGSASGWFCASAAAGFAQNLRRDLYYKVQDFSFSNIGRFSTSSLVTRLTTDVSNVQQAFMMMIRMAVRAPMMLIFATVMSIQVGKQLAFIFAGIIPVLGFCLYLMAKTAMPLFKAVFKKYDRLNNSVQENVQAMRVVKSFVREDYETEKFTAESDDVRGDFLRAEKILALNNPLMQFCISVCRILISYFAAKLIVQSGGTYLNVGALTSMITYSMQILMGLMMLSMVFVMITMASASAKRICEVLDEESDLHNPDSPSMMCRTAAWILKTSASNTPQRRIAWRWKTSICIFLPGRPSASSAAPVLPKQASYSSFPVCMTRRKVVFSSAGTTYATTIWSRFAIRLP